MDIKDTLAQRQHTHGEFADNADIMQTLKDAVRARPGWNGLDATKREALDMILHKVGRIVTGNPEEPDHWHDIAGYATLARDRVKKGLADAPFELSPEATRLAVLDKLGS